MSTKTETVEQVKIKFPSMYNVVLLNDDRTTMEFVVMILIEIFDQDQKAAVETMMAVHNEGKGVAGTYTKEIAEQKAEECRQLAKANEYPLSLAVEES